MEKVNSVRQIYSELDAAIKAGNRAKEKELIQKLCKLDRKGSFDYPVSCCTHLQRTYNRTDYP